MQEELLLKTNFMMLKIQIDALKSILSNDQTTKFRYVKYSKQMGILSKHIKIYKLISN
jgi:hypothetical protein